MAEEKQEKVNLESIVPTTILSQLRESFPASTHESKRMDDGFVQTGVKPAYVIERLNAVLGIEGWEAEELETRIESPFYATKVKLTVFLIVKDGNGLLNKIPIATRTQWGSAKSHSKSELGDVLKSAFTNGLCKAASMLDVAHEAYKGILPPVVSKENLVVDESEAAEYDKKEAKKKTLARSTPKSEEPANKDLRALRKEILTKFTEKNLTRNDLEKMMIDNFGKNESRQLDETELKRLSSLIDEIPNESLSENSEGNSQ